MHIVLTFGDSIHVKDTKGNSYIIDLSRFELEIL